MTSVFHRSLAGSYPNAVSGRGLLLTDETGKAYIDGCGGAAVSCLGHGHPDVLAAMHAQLEKLAYAHSSFFSTEVAEALADDLIAHAPRGMAKVYFVSGGSEAIETALKMARQYFLEKGETRRTRFIGRRQSFHGNTLGALSVGGNEWRKQPYAPLLVDHSLVSPCYEYRERASGETSEQYTTRLLNELEAEILRAGPETIIAFVAETVGGSTAGAITATPGYFSGIRKLCDRFGILLILDEVMCGMGRTGSLYACEQEGVAPDLIAIAKGLGGGYAPIGATLASERVVGAFENGSKAFQHGHTYIGHPLACSAALAVQRVIRRDGLLENVRVQGQRLHSRLQERFGNHHHVGDVRGRGLFQAIEFVADRGTKAPFAPELALNSRVKAEAMKRGLMIYPMGGTVDGRRGDHVLIAPPFIVDQTTIDTIVERLGEAVDAAIGHRL